MRYIIFCALFCLLFCVNAVAAEPVENGERGDKATKPLVFFNSNAQYPDAVAVNGGYSEFAKALRANGFRADHGWLTGIDDDTLEGVDIFVLAMPKFTLLDEDKVALKKWVRNGGGLLLMGYWEADNSNLDSFIKEFGISFGLDIIGGWSADVDQQSYLAGPESCETIGIHTPMQYFKYLNVDASKGAYSVARNPQNNKIAAAISENKGLGKGKLVVIGTTTIFCQPGYVFEYDNMAFGINICKYLTGQSSTFDLKPVLCKYKGNNLTAGDKITLIAKIKNVGNGVSEKTKVSFILTDDGTLSGPPSTLVTLKTVTLGELDPNKKKKIKVTGKLPDWLSPGDYYLHVVVDPDGKTGDTDPSNNMLEGKKTIPVN